MISANETCMGFADDQSVKKGMGSADDALTVIRRKHRVTRLHGKIIPLEDNN